VFPRDVFDYGTQKPCATRRAEQTVSRTGLWATERAAEVRIKSEILIYTAVAEDYEARLCHHLPTTLTTLI
jgi:hypothetical protein